MDVRHREIWLRIKLPNQLETQIVHASSIVTGLQEIARIMAAAPNRYGDGVIDYSFKPMKQHDDFAIEYPGLDRSLVQPITPELQDKLDRNPINPNSPAYDSMYAEYRYCGVSSYRETKGRDELDTLKRHVESTYAGTEWWDGTHKW